MWRPNSKKFVLRGKENPPGENLHLPIGKLSGNVDPRSFGCGAEDSAGAPFVQADRNKLFACFHLLREPIEQPFVQSHRISILATGGREPELSYHARGGIGQFVRLIVNSLVVFGHGRLLLKFDRTAKCTI